MIHQKLGGLWDKSWQKGNKGQSLKIPFFKKIYSSKSPWNFM